LVGLRLNSGTPGSLGFFYRIIITKKIGKGLTTKSISITNHMKKDGVDISIPELPGLKAGIKSYLWL